MCGLCFVEKGKIKAFMKSALPGPQKSWTKSLCLCVSDVLLRIENITTHQNYELGYFQQKKTGGRPHGVSLPWVPKSLILSTYGRKFDAGSLGTKSNIAKTSCGFVRLDLKFEKPKAEGKCMLLGVSSAWGVIEKLLLSATWKTGSGAINYKFLSRSRVLHSYHIHTLPGESKCERRRGDEILPSP
jgi:hypothetical protein